MMCIGFCFMVLLIMFYIRFNPFLYIKHKSISILLYFLDFILPFAVLAPKTILTLNLRCCCGGMKHVS